MFILRNEGLAANPTSFSKSVPVFDLCRRRLPRPGRGVGVHLERLGVFTSPNLSPFDSNPLTRNLASAVGALDAASSISPLIATLTKNTRGGVMRNRAHYWPLTGFRSAHTRKAATSLNSCGCGQFAVHPGVGGYSAGSALADQARVAGITRPSRLKDEAGGAGVKLAAAAPDMTCWKAAWKRSISACVPTVMRT